MASEKKRGNREAKKSKKQAPKVLAAAPSTKDVVSAAVNSAKQK
ncbi:MULTISPECIES: hypothetical protein [Methylobacterium]|uniref:Uncharacterized protein n=1 Tax=Methylobacterium isbiliense TaxID=315478 RepID=A0ABQ4SG45_9HYPH|nr:MULTISPECIES: hypothetical protein [Methylobacterium]MDN3626771.1 hypothetical protein [Methylobacterium isbiliense]GJE02190.1 hypothetical protein GMJLKIPL_4134 [Methylobacterium isbiliense]